MPNTLNVILTQENHDTVQALPKARKSMNFRYLGKATFILIMGLFLSATLRAQETQESQPAEVEPQAVELQAPKTDSSWMFSLSDVISWDEHSISHITNIGFRNMPKKWGFETSITFLPSLSQAGFGFSIKPSYSFLNFTKAGEKRFCINASLRLGVLFVTIVDDDNEDSSFVLPFPLILPEIGFEMYFSRKFAISADVLVPASFQQIILELGIKIR